MRVVVIRKEAVRGGVYFGEEVWSEVFWDTLAHKACFQRQREGSVVQGLVPTSSHFLGF